MYLNSLFVETKLEKIVINAYMVSEHKGHPYSLSAYRTESPTERGPFIFLLCRKRINSAARSHRLTNTYLSAMSSAADNLQPQALARLCAWNKRRNRETSVQTDLASAAEVDKPSYRSLLHNASLTSDRLPLHSGALQSTSSFASPQTWSFHLLEFQDCWRKLRSRTHGCVRA